ncbi:MAG TPA: recombinase family protein, partial [Bacteroidia bacterium]|nr:recombinase family protein [Bacteroidia bacterium]
FYWKANDRLNNAEILHRLKNAGLNIHKQKLTKILNNPFYCGIMSHNLLNGEVIEGKHEKLISKDIFLLANSIKSRNTTWKHSKDFSKVPLKNFLKCGVCGSSFCGYLVKKKNLWYYKCNKTGCKCNKSAITLNKLFIERLNKFTVMEKYIEPVKDEFIKLFTETSKESVNHIKVLNTRLQETERKMDAIDERFATGEIDKDLYQKFISKYKTEKSEINTELDSLSFKNSNLEKGLEKYCQILTKPSLLWASNGYKGKLELQELMFPKGISYDREKNDFRTPEINEVVFAMAEIARDIEGKDKGDLCNFNIKSPLVPGTGLEPVRLLRSQDFLTGYGFRRDCAPQSLWSGLYLDHTSRLRPPPSSLYTFP